MKKIIVSVLLVAMLLSFAACGGNGNSDITTSGSTTTASVATVDPDESFELPAESSDYSGKFIILNGFSSATTLFTTCTMVSEDGGAGDALDTAIYRRSIIMKDRYGVDIRELPVAVSQQYSTVEKDRNSSSHSFDIAMINTTNVAKLALAGYCYDLTTMDNISLEKAWWDQSANAQLRYGQHLYYTYSDMDTTQFDSVRCIYFNQELMRKHGMSTDELYKKAIDGKWTLEEMYTYAKDVFEDNGDGISDAEDIYPIVGVPSTTFSALLSGCDASYVKIDAATSLPYAYFTSERFGNVYDKILNVMFGENFFYTGCSKNTQATNMFVNGHALFLLTTIVSSNTMRQSMSADFGFLPLPKYDTDQEKYICNAPNPYAIMVPSDSQNADRTGFILEAMSYISHDTVRTAYFEVRLYGRTSRDALSWQTLDIIYSNIAYSVPVESSVNYQSEINKMMVDNDRGISAYVASVKGVVEADIKKFIDKVNQ